MEVSSQMLVKKPKSEEIETQKKLLILFTKAYLKREVESVVLKLRHTYTITNISN